MSPADRELMRVMRHVNKSNTTVFKNATKYGFSEFCKKLNIKNRRNKMLQSLKHNLNNGRFFYANFRRAMAKTQ